MLIKALAMIVTMTGILAGQAQAGQPGVPDGKWFGDITSKCTVDDAFTDFWNLRNPHLEVTCSSGRCFAQLSYQFYEKDTNELAKNLIPGWAEMGYRITVVGWGPIRSRYIENGKILTNDGHDFSEDNEEQQNVEAYLDGLTLVFLPNDDLSVSIDRQHTKCSGILLPKI